MRCPTLSELPSPPPGKTGWPWTEESPQLPEAMPDGSPWPSVSIITPSFNSADSIEETIRSVLGQDYPNMEYIVVDGGSTDGTLNILKRHQGLQWISEPDSGQADALNKGFRRARGEIIGWINADDLYAPHAIAAAAAFFDAHPGVDLVHGDIAWIDGVGSPIRLIQGCEFDLASALLSNPINQQAAFFRRNVFDQIGYLRTDLHYILDYEFWLRMGRRVQSCHVPELWAYYRMMPGTKSVEYPERFWLEALIVFDELFADATLPGSIQTIRQRACGRMHWLAGLGLCRSGQLATARSHCIAALTEYRLLEVDYDFAVQACRFVEAHEFRQPVNANWLKLLLVDLQTIVPTQHPFYAQARALFYGTRADYFAAQAHWPVVRADTLRALWYDARHWATNRGFVRQGLKAFTGHDVVGVAKRLKGRATIKKEGAGN